MTGSILLSRLNNLQSRISLILGNGAGDRGYGQVVSSRQIPRIEDPTITAEDINLIFDDLIRARVHQIGYNNYINSETRIYEVLKDVSLIGLDRSQNVNVDNNELIIEDDVKDGINYSEYRGITDYENLIKQIEQDRFLVSPTQIYHDTGIESARTSAWKNKIYHEFSVNFTSSNHRRHFFNAGGKLYFDFSFSNPGNENSEEWTNLISSVGTIIFNYQETISTQGSVLVGNYSLSSDYISIYKKETSNDRYIEIKVKEASASSIVFIVEFVENSESNLVAGRLLSRITYDLPQGSFVYNSKSYTSVVVARPTFTNIIGLNSFPTPLSVYTLYSSKTSVIENDTFTITLNTVNVLDNTTIPYTITGITSDDITGESLTGNFVVNSNTAQKQFTTIDNILDEKTFKLKLDGIQNQVTVIFNKTPIPLPANETITCIAVINEANDHTYESLRAGWLAFRARWPNRPFYLLQPTPGIVPVGAYVGTLPGTLYTPEEFKNDEKAFGPYLVSFDKYVRVLQDFADLKSGISELDTASYSDWYTICNIQPGSAVAVCLDSSDSMRGAVNYNLTVFLEKTNANNVTSIVFSNRREYWPGWFNGDLLPN